MLQRLMLKQIKIVEKTGLHTNSLA